MKCITKILEYYIFLPSNMVMQTTLSKLRRGIRKQNKDKKIKIVHWIGEERQLIYAGDKENEKSCINYRYIISTVLINYNHESLYLFIRLFIMNKYSVNHEYICDDEYINFNRHGDSGFIPKNLTIKKLFSLCSNYFIDIL